VPQGLSFWRKMLAFSGPGYLVSCGLHGPGELGHRSRGWIGLRLLAAERVLISNLMAILLPITLRELGLSPAAISLRPAGSLLQAGGRRPVVLCEIAICACDLAEVIGSAIALNLLFKLPLTWASASRRSTSWW